MQKYYGYIYKISIPTSKGIRFYIGKRVAPVLKPAYWGSGIKIQRWVKKHTNNQYNSYNLPSKIASQLKLKREILYWAKDNIELCNKEYEFTKDILNNPQYWNLRAGGDQIGFSIETRKKMSLARKGKPSWSKGLTKETDERLRNKALNQLGKPLSKKHRLALHKPKSVSSSKKGKTYEELYGKEKALQLKLLFSKQRKGKPQSEELRKKRGLGLRGRILSPEHRLKISIANKKAKHKK